MIWNWWKRLGRKSKSLADYRALAEENDLTFESEQAPAEISISTLWECKRCGRRLKKSYANVRYGQHACICRSDKQLHEDDYREIADRLGLRWAGDHLPKNVREPTTWFSSIQNGYFDAPYQALAYKKPSKMYAGYVLAPVSRL